MKNIHYDAYGVLKLDTITPIISTLFHGYKLEKSHLNDDVYVSQLSSRSKANWNDLMFALVNLAKQRNLSLPSDYPLNAVLKGFAQHFGVDSQSELTAFIEQGHFSNTPEIADLFLLATAFDDGHHLTTIQYTSLWYCSRSPSLQFGHDNYFLSKEVRLFATSTHTHVLGEKLRNAALTNAVAECAHLLIDELLHSLSGICNTSLRADIHRHIAERLAFDPEN